MKHRPSRRQWLLARYVFFAALSACQAPLSHSSDPSVFRCESDGLCLITDKVGAGSLIGGFRRGNEEMKFEFLHRPVPDPEHPEWCQRLQDTLGERMYSNDAPGCPENWSNGSWNGPGHGTIQEPRDRFAMIKVMIEQLKAGRAPAGREEAYSRLLQILEELYDNRTGEMFNENQRKYFPDVPNSATGDYRAIGDPNYDGHTPPDIPYPSELKKKVDRR